MQFESNDQYFQENLTNNVIKCPKCGSLFIEDNICESCNYNLDFDPLGEPLGIKSYFNLKEDYLFHRNLIFQFFPFLENLIQTSQRREYQRKLNFRMKLIFDHIDYYYSDENKYNLYALELAEIFKELIRLGENERYLLNKLESNFTIQDEVFQKVSYSLLSEDIQTSNVVYKSIKLLLYGLILAGVLFIFFILINY